MLIPADRITLRSWLAWYHMLAGAAGVITALLVALQLLDQVPPASRPLVGLMFLAMAALFGVVAWAGVLLSMTSPWGPQVATVMQLLQIPALRVGRFMWMFFGGGYLVPYWQIGSGLGVILGVKANCQLSWGQAAQGLTFGVNVVPLVVLWLLRRKLPCNEALQLTGAATHPDDRAISIATQ